MSKDYDIFSFPPIDPSVVQGVPILVGGDVVNCFTRRPEVIAFAKFLLSSITAEPALVPSFSKC
jgi:hypothetical protein